MGIYSTTKVMYKRFISIDELILTQIYVGTDVLVVNYGDSKSDQKRKRTLPKRFYKPV